MKGLSIFIGGVAVGTAIGLLLAPERGSENRAKLKEYLRRKGLLPANEIDILIEEVQSDPTAHFDKAVRPRVKASEKETLTEKEEK